MNYSICYIPGRLINCRYSFSARARSFSKVNACFLINNSSSSLCNAVRSRTIRKHSRSQSDFFVGSVNGEPGICKNMF